MELEVGLGQAERIAADVVSGRLRLDRLIPETIALDDIDAAFESMRRREGARRVIRFDA